MIAGRILVTLFLLPQVEDQHNEVRIVTGTSIATIQHQCIRFYHLTFSMADDDQQKARDIANREVAKLWRAWRTVHEMVHDRVCDHGKTLIDGVADTNP